jgi:peptide/nickel transport system permease protein
LIQYTLRRIGVYIIVLFFISIFSFAIIHLAPGDPIEMMINPDTPAEVAAARREALGLNKSLVVQFIRWLEAVFQGNLGYSLFAKRSVSIMISERMGNTMILVLVSMVISLLISIPLGIFSAIHQNSFLDHATSGFAIMLISSPAFFIALGLIFIFGLRLGWLPTSGTITLGADNNLCDRVLHMILPVSVMALNSIGIFVRYVRSSMLEVLNQDYIRTARSKGIKRSLVIYQHALRNAINPLVTIFGVQLAAELAGSVTIEKIFSWPGVGRLVFESVLNRDYPVIMGVCLVMGILIILINIVIDILYALIDPRIRLS